MILLAIDSSGRHGGVTLADADRHSFKVLGSAAIEGGTFSAQLIPQISRLLNDTATSLAQLRGLIAVTGPGSFTGLRVGLTAIKGLAEALSLPIAAVTSLELILFAAGEDLANMAIIDAGRGEVYARIPPAEEFLLPAENARELAQSRNLRLITTDTRLATIFEDVRVLNFSSSELAARAGFRKLLREETVDVLALDANYIRKSEAEYLRKLQK